MSDEHSGLAAATPLVAGDGLRDRSPQPAGGTDHRFSPGDRVVVNKVYPVHTIHGQAGTVKRADAEFGGWKVHLDCNPEPILMWEKELDPEPIPFVLTEKAHDAVHHPFHYTQHPSGVECITVVEHMGFSLGNVVKYVWRADLKGGVEDLKKARFYLDREIAKREKA